MIFDYLTKTDKENIQTYIDNYAIGEDDGYCESIGLSVLAEWSKQKEQLFHLFGDKFIVSKEIEYEATAKDLNQKITKTLLASPEHEEFVQGIRDLFPYIRYRGGMTAEESIEREINNKYSHLCRYLLDCKVLRENSFSETCCYSPCSYEIPLKNNKKLKFQKGAKPMKILKKLADSYGIEGFEKFRNAHSCCLQSKSMKGELCLSIHPLDYMTMSDNTLGWETCMSWTHEGDFRGGTVEMMNSPVVVVAYIKSEHKDFEFAGSDNIWNNKKWRCLFIVDAETGFICSIKSYPYYNADLVKTAATTLSEIIGWGKIEATEHKYGNYTEVNNNVRFSIETEDYGNAMYNDFGCDYAHWVIVDPNRDFDGWCEIKDYNYSGKYTCMSCGKELSISNDGDEYSLVCAHLDPSTYTRCDCCEQRIRRHRDICTILDGNDNYVDICEDCYEDYTTYDDLIRDYIYENNAIDVDISISSEECIIPEHYDHFTTNMNCKYEISDRYKKYFVEGFEYIHYNQSEYIYWVGIDDLSEEGKKLLGFPTEYSVQEYKNSFSKEDNN